MAIRTFIFCDVCNPSGIRTIEVRRGHIRRGGRRISDDRAWFEGTIEEAKSFGWHVDTNNIHRCEHCAKKINPPAESAEKDMGVVASA